jgi:hypothetical protein
MKKIEIMLPLIRHVIGRINLPLLNGPVSLPNPLGKWSIEEPEKWGNISMTGGG